VSRTVNRPGRFLWSKSILWSMVDNRKERKLSEVKVKKGRIRTRMSKKYKSFF